MARTLVLVAALATLSVGGATSMEARATSFEAQAPQATPAAPAMKADLSGVYVCEGKNPDGSAYQGVVEIAAVESTYLVHWVLPRGVEVLGVGILREDTLSVSYFGGTPVIVVYKKEGNRLVGAWTMGGTEGAVFVETLTPMDPASSVGVGKRPVRTNPHAPTFRL